MTSEGLGNAEEALAEFKWSLGAGHPWVPGATFNKNPGLDLHIQAALEGFVHAKRVAEQAKPARRESLSESPRVPITPGMREWTGLGLDGKDVGENQKAPDLL